MINYKEERILIWGKTYPELSSRYTETVCTGGVLENGKPVRLYPIPYRYLEGEQKFKGYQWIKAKIVRDLRDPRPESHRVEENSIVCEEVIPTTKDEWGKRAEILFRDKSWLFDSVEDLRAKEREDRTSLGVVEPLKILGIKIKDRDEEEKQTFEQKLEFLKKEDEARQAQNVLFEELLPPEMKSLRYVPSRLEIHWQCHGKDCKTHNMQILDWGLIELQGREGIEKAKEKLESICNLDKYTLKFFLGNIHNHPTSFTIVGLWYPKRVTDLLFR